MIAAAPFTWSRLTMSELVSPTCSPFTNLTPIFGLMTSEKNAPINEEAYNAQCPMCTAGTLREGTTTLTMERGGATIVVKGVPADVCDVCGEAFIDEDVSAAVYEQAEAAVEAGAQFDVRRYTAPEKAPA